MKLRRCGVDAVPTTSPPFELDAIWIEALAGYAAAVGTRRSG